MEKRILFVVLLGAAIWVGTPGGALAGGQEFGAPGAHSLGRGGAYYARSDNALALFYNPANLAAVNEHSFVFDSMATFYDLCVKREGNYGQFAGGDRSIWGGPDQYGDIEYPEVCSNAPPGTVPQLAFAFRPVKWFGFGFGVLAPPGIGHVRFGDKAKNPLVKVNDPNGMIDKLPSPLRYMTAEQRAAAVYPTIGIGIAPHPRFRFGVAFGSGIASYNTVSYGSVYGNQLMGNDIRSELSASTFFIPRVTGSVHIVPFDAIDLMGGITWTGNQKADGTLKLTSGQWSATDPVTGGPVTSGSANIEGVTLRIPMAWSAVGGIRYAHRIRPRVFEQRSQEIEDSFATEHWDLEFNFIYEKNSRLGDVVLSMPDVAQIDIEGLGLFDVADAVIFHKTRDQMGFRLGGDWNIVPGAFSLSLGGSYETSGASKAFMNVDYLPVQRIGAHIGLTARIARTDLSIAYARYFQETIDNRGQARLQVQASEGQEPPADFTINEGVYKSSLQLFSFMVAYHFR